MARAQRIRPADSNPFDDLDPLAFLLHRQSGVISRRQALRHLTRSAVDHRLVTGAWRVAHHGVYVSGAIGDPTPAQLRWVAALSAGYGRPAVLGGLSALQGDGLRGFASEEVHVVIPAQYREHDPPPYTVVHRTSRLAAAEVRRTGAPPGTVPGRSVVDAAQWASADSYAAAVVAAAVQQRLAVPDEVRQAVDGQPRARRRALVLAVVHDLDAGARSVPEAEFLRLCRRARLPAPECQVRRTDAAGRRRYLDAYFAPYGVHVEVDGAQHDTARARWADLRRQNDIWIAGDRILRFPAWVVRSRPAEVAAQVRAALVAAGWSPESAVVRAG